MRIIALFAHSSCVLTRFGVIISGQDVNRGIALQAASGGREIHQDSGHRSHQSLKDASNQIHLSLIVLSINAGPLPSPHCPRVREVEG